MRNNQSSAPADVPGLLHDLMERGLTQAEIGRRLGAVPHTVCDWVSGKRKPDMRHAAMLDRLWREVCGDD